MLVCPNCGAEMDISEIGEVCTNCGVQIPLDMEAGTGEEAGEEKAT
ncbi:MAG: hypothetical protein ACYC99_04925 [Candidatus Geothermincolia bacterium]